MRKCKKCGHDKPDSEFYNYGLGFMDNCIDCTKDTLMVQQMLCRKQDRIIAYREKP